MKSGLVEHDIKFGRDDTLMMVADASEGFRE